MRRPPSRMHQNGDADESKDDATRHHPVQSFVAGEMGDERHPERYRGHQQGGEPSQRMLITANSQNTIAFAVHLPDRSVHYWNTGWNLRLVRPVGDHLVGATLFDGIVVQPRMIDSSEVAGQRQTTVANEE